MNSANNKRVLRGILGAAFVLFVMFSSTIAYAAAPKIYIWHNDSDASALYKNIYVGESGELGLKAENTTINTAVWSSSNSSITSVSGNENGVTLNVLKEGVVTISVSASTTDGTLTDSVTLSAITKIRPTVSSYTNASASMLRAGTSSALSRGTVDTGFQFQIYGACGNYYYGRVPDDYNFNDTMGRYVYILKSRLNIPATDLNISIEHDKVNVGESNKLSYKLLPALGNMNESVLWQSSNTSIATVDSSGNITTLKAGKVTFTGTIQGTSISKSITIDIVPSSPKLSSEVVGFKDIKLKWGKAAGANGYEIERYDTTSKKYKVIKDITSANTLSFKNTGLKDGTKYQYRVRAYANGDGGKRVYGNYSNVYKVTTNKLKLNVKTDTKAKMKWTKTSGVSGYEISRRASKQKTVKGSAKGTASSYSNTGLKKSTTYYYKIRPYKLVNGKKEYYSYSSEVKVATYNTTTGYFYDQVKWKKVWPGVKITSGKASNSTMDKYEIYDSRNNKQFKSSVKYNYSTKNKTLYIHVYVKFSGAGANQKFEYYQYKNGKYQKTKTGEKTYKTLAKEGFKNYWTKTVEGSSYDFKNGVKFKTQVVLHESGESGQKFIPIKIGVNSSEGQVNGEYWHFVTSTGWGTTKDKTDKGRYKIKYNYSGTTRYIHLATQKQTTKNSRKENQKSGYWPEDTMEDYRSVAGHELGHCFGIDDGYSIKSGKVKRVIPTKEIGIVDKSEDDGVKNIMVGTRKIKATNNDIEMALQAQGDVINAKPYSFHSYKTYSDGDWQYKKSSVIRLKK